MHGYYAIMRKLMTKPDVMIAIGAPATIWVAFISLLGGGVILRAGESAPSTPAAALAAFSKAVEIGDAATLSTLVTGDTKEREWIVAYSAQLRAFSDLEHALAKRFGKGYAEEESGMGIREQIETARDEELGVDLKQAKLGKPDGDTALVIFDEAASDDLQGRLVRVDGRWKMEIGSLANYFSVDDTPGLRAMADAASGLARDLGAGKLPSLDETAKAVEERFIAAEEVGAKKPQLAPIVKAPAKPKQP